MKTFSAESLALVDRLRSLMARHDWTQHELARYLGVPHGTVTNWLQHTREPSSSVARLVQVLAIVEALAPALHGTLMPGERVQGQPMLTSDDDQV